MIRGVLCWCYIWSRRAHREILISIMVCIGNQIFFNEAEYVTYTFYTLLVTLWCFYTSSDDLSHSTKIYYFVFYIRDHFNPFIIYSSIELWNCMCHLSTVCVPCVSRGDRIGSRHSPCLFVGGDLSRGSVFAVHCDRNVWVKWSKFLFWR